MTDKGKDSLLATATDAANWYLVFESEDTVSEEDRRSFVRWLRRSPANIEEFMRVGAMRKSFSDPLLKELPSVKTLIHAARSNVVALNQAQTIRRPSTRVKPPAPMAAQSKLIGGIAALLVIAVMTLLWFTDVGFDNINFGSGGGYAGGGYVIETALGEQRSTLLSDGSVVNLNTQSRLVVSYSEGVRRVELSAGEAFFDVAKDATRPFRVHSGPAVVEAIGTRFNVYQQHTQTVITVVDGQVSVMNAAGASSARKTLPGNQVAVSTNGAIAASTPVDPDRATAWTDRRLVFDHDSLDIVVRELNRYNTKQLTVGDAPLPQRAISGIFNANDPAALMTFLVEIGGLHIETDASGKGWTLYPQPVAAPDSPE